MISNKPNGGRESRKRNWKNRLSLLGKLSRMSSKNQRCSKIQRDLSKKCSTRKPICNWFNTAPVRSDQNERLRPSLKETKKTDCFGKYTKKENLTFINIPEKQWENCWEILTTFQNFVFTLFIALVNQRLKWWQPYGKRARGQLLRNLWAGVHRAGSACWKSSQEIRQIQKCVHNTIIGGD